MTETAQIRFDPWELVLALAWSPDGSRLAIAAGENIQVYDAGQFTRLDSLPIGAFTYSLAFSPDGSWLAAGSRDGKVRLWDLAGRSGSQPLYSLEAHKKGVNSLAFSPDGRWLASGGNDAVAKLWDVGTGTLVQTIIGGTFAVPGIAFEPGNGMLAILNGQVLRLREPESGRLAGTLRVDAPLYCLAFSPDGRYLALGDSDNTIRYWETSSTIGADIETPPPQGTLVGHSGAKGSPSALIWSLVFSPDSSLLASAGGDGVTRLWDLDSGHPVGTLATQSRPVTSLAFSPDGRRLATGSLDGTVRFWSAKS